MTSFEELEDYTFGMQEEEDLDKYYSGKQEPKIKQFLQKHGKTIALVVAAIIILILIVTTILFALLFLLSGGSGDPNNNNTKTNSTSPTPTTASSPTLSPSQQSHFPSASSSPIPGSDFDPVIISYWEDLAAELHSNINSSIDPCEDFYEYACGGWLAKTELEAGEVEYYRSFDTISDFVDQVVQGIIDADWPMIGTFYSNCMDINLRNEIGSSPLIPYLDQIDQLISLDSLPTLLGNFQRFGIGGFFDIDVSPDLYTPEHYNFEIDQGGIGMPERSYYFMDDSYGLSVQQAYKIYIKKGLAAIQEYVTPDEETSLPLEDQAENIYQLEVQLARICNTTQERRDILGLYNLYTILQLSYLTPDFNWSLFFTTINLDPSINTVNVISPSFFSSLDDILADTPISLIRNYLRWRTVLKTSPLLSQSYLDIEYEYIGALYGSDVSPSIDEICLSRTNSVLGMLVGRYFIEEVWDEEFQLRAEQLVNSIEVSFHNHLPDVDWMDQETTVQAEVKLSMVVDKIGFPTIWPDYSTFIIYPDQWFNNSMEGRKFNFDNMIATAPTTNDKQDWDMNPQTVNAYYNPQENEMVFPAAILQEPMFSKRYPDAMNYGGIGAVMGHELTHGFDDQGRQFDGTGAYRNWWTQTASANYDERTQCVIDLYNQFEVEPGVYVNGAQTLGENIADMGGVKDAYRALLTNLVNNQYNTQIEEIFGMTNEQLFFVSYGQLWCAKILPEYEELLAIVDVHSPAKARVNNPLSQFDSFAEAFSCPVDSPMNPSQKCVVW